MSAHAQLERLRGRLRSATFSASHVSGRRWWLRGVAMVVLGGLLVFAGDGHGRILAIGILVLLAGLGARVRGLRRRGR